MKCRAILPTNRGGVEPYFDADSMPPGNSWVNSSIRVGSWPTQQSDPSTYLAQATYTSFQQAQSVTFYTDLVRLGITEVYINERQYRGYSVTFPDVQPSRTVRLSVCRRGYGQQHPFIQVTGFFFFLSFTVLHVLTRSSLKSTDHGFPPCHRAVSLSSKLSSTTSLAFGWARRSRSSQCI